MNKVILTLLVSAFIVVLEGCTSSLVQPERVLASSGEIFCIGVESRPARWSYYYGAQCSKGAPREIYSSHFNVISYDEVNKLKRKSEITNEMLHDGLQLADSFDGFDLFLSNLRSKNFCIIAKWSNHSDDNGFIVGCSKGVRFQIAPTEKPSISSLLLNGFRKVSEIQKCRIMSPAVFDSCEIFEK